MSENKPEVTKNDEKEKDKPAPAAKKQEGPAGAASGRIVHFRRSVNSGNGLRHEDWPAILLCPADKASNFKPSDGAWDLQVFTKHGNEVKSGVMFSESPASGRWSFPPKV